MWAAELEHAELDVRHCGCGEPGRGGARGVAGGGAGLRRCRGRRPVPGRRQQLCLPAGRLPAPPLQVPPFSQAGHPRALLGCPLVPQGRTRQPRGNSETMRRRYQGGFLTSTAFESEGGGGSGVVSGAPFRAEVEIERVVVLGLPGGPKGWQVTHSSATPSPRCRPAVVHPRASLRPAA